MLILDLVISFIVIASRVSGVAIQSHKHRPLPETLDCRVASLLAMTQRRVIQPEHIRR